MVTVAGLTARAPEAKGGGGAGVAHAAHHQGLTLAAAVIPDNQSEVSIVSINQSEASITCHTWQRCSRCCHSYTAAPRRPAINNTPIRDQYSGHMICLDQSDTSIQVT